VEASITVFEFPWDVRDFSPPVSFIPDNGLADEYIPARDDFTGLLLGYLKQSHIHYRISAEKINPPGTNTFGSRSFAIDLPSAFSLVRPLLDR
jgi:hypothetical protein